MEMLKEKQELEAEQLKLKQKLGANHLKTSIIASNVKQEALRELEMGSSSSHKSLVIHSTVPSIVMPPAMHARSISVNYSNIVRSPNNVLIIKEDLPAKEPTVYKGSTMTFFHWLQQ